MSLWKSKLPKLKGLGLEIGALDKPYAGVSPFYTDQFLEFAGIDTRSDFLSNAAYLPLPNATLDYVIASHVLEHLTDPISCLIEWLRVLKPDGALMIILPHHDYSFDRNRAVTPLDKLWLDFGQSHNAIAQRRIEEFALGVDMTWMNPDIPNYEHLEERLKLLKLYREAASKGEPVDIHFNTFTPSSFQKLLQSMEPILRDVARWKITHVKHPFPTDDNVGFMVALQKTENVLPGQSSQDGTYQLEKDSAETSLPLCCPKSLKPLSLNHDQLSVAGGEPYSFTNGVPDLRIESRPLPQWW